VGDGVEVPFGSRVSQGLVLGQGDPTYATKAITRVVGKRAEVADIDLARELATRNFSNFEAIAPRLAPRSGLDATPLAAGRLLLVKGVSYDDLGRKQVYSQAPRRLLACAPLVDQSRLAALEAQEIARRGQVLVLCPTKAHVEQVLAQFRSGAARMDQKPKKGEPSPWRAFADGTLKVAIATRTAVLWAAPKLAGIIVVDEGHPGHVEALHPHTNARDVAATRTHRLGIDLVLLSYNPSPLGLGAEVKVLSVGTERHWPTMTLVERPVKERHQMDVPGPVAQALLSARREEQLAVVVASTAKARRQCSSCKGTLYCSVCDDYDCEHLRGAACPRCGATRSYTFGWDPRRVSQAVGKPAKVVTTKALLDMKDCGLVILYDGDGALGIPELIPGRWAGSLVLAAARAAGEGGHVMVVTGQPTAEPFDDLVAHKDIVRAAKRTWVAAKKAGLPPFGRLVNLRVASDKPPRTTGWPGTVYGPKKVGADYEVLVRCADEDLAELGRCVDRLRKRAKVRLSVS
jgi:primosomal protein N'